FHLLFGCNQRRGDRDGKCRILVASGSQHRQPPTLAQTPKSNPLSIYSRELGQRVLPGDRIVSESLVVGVLQISGRLAASPPVVDQHRNAHRRQAFPQVSIKPCGAGWFRCSMQSYHRGQVVAVLGEVGCADQACIAKTYLLRHYGRFCMDMPKIRRQCWRTLRRADPGAKDKHRSQIPPHRTTHFVEYLVASVVPTVHACCQGPSLDRRKTDNECSGNSRLFPELGLGGEMDDLKLSWSPARRPG